MEIGILTFHWATNYGAILQSYALQTFLSERGHSVDIINYKPKSGDNNISYIVKHPSLWKNYKRLLAQKKKERLLTPFREKNLVMTTRYYTTTELKQIAEKYDVLISGSDQVFSPSFTLYGEDGKICTAYWQGFAGKEVKRIGYAVSFGCTHYPENATEVAKRWINGFNAIGVREHTGLQILEELDYKGMKEVLPDPTLLLGKKLFDKLGLDASAKQCGYTCVYMLRHEIELGGNVRYIDEKHHPLTMEQWLQTIVNAKQMVTNSYHGMIIAMFAHVPFAVLLETGGGSGMNDRFHTLLRRLEIEDRVATTVDEAMSVLEKPIDFEKVDAAFAKYRKVGVDFLNSSIG